MTKVAGDNTMPEKLTSGVSRCTNVYMKLVL